MVKKFSLVILLVFFSKNSQSQNESNVPYQSLVAINPSFAGSNGLVRSQTFLQVPFDSQRDYFFVNSAADVYLSSLKSGLSVSVNHFQNATYSKNTSGEISYAKYFTIKEHLKIIPSVQVGYNVKQMNIYDWRNYGSDTRWVRSEYFSLNGGLLVNYKNFYGGVSVFNMNRPDVGMFSVEKTNPLYNIHASYNLKMSDELLFNLHGQLSTRKDYWRQSVTVNALIFKHLIYGVGYHWRDVALMTLGYRTNYFVFQLAYNKNIDRLKHSDVSVDYWHFIMSFNLRNKEQRHTLTNFEAW